MKYLFCEIKDDDVLVVIRQNVTEEQVEDLCGWSDKYENKNLVLIPYKSVEVTSKNYGHDIDVRIG